MTLPNLDDLAQVGIHPLKTPEAAIRLRDAAKASALTYLVVDLAGIRDKAELLKCLAERLAFPPYFGHNWDALYDILCDKEWFSDCGIVLHLQHHASFDELVASDWLTLCTILEETISYWRDSGLRFWVFIEEQ